MKLSTRIFYREDNAPSMNNALQCTARTMFARDVENHNLATSTLIAVVTTFVTRTRFIHTCLFVLHSRHPMQVAKKRLNVSIPSTAGMQMLRSRQSMVTLRTINSACQCSHRTKVSLLAGNQTILKIQRLRTSDGMASIVTVV